MLSTSSTSPLARAQHPSHRLPTRTRLFSTSVKRESTSLLSGCSVGSLNRYDVMSPTLPQVRNNIVLQQLIRLSTSIVKTVVDPRMTSSLQTKIYRSIGNPTRYQPQASHQLKKPRSSLLRTQPLTSCGMLICEINYYIPHLCDRSYYDRSTI